MTAALVLWLLAAYVAYTIKGFSGFGPALIVLPVVSALYSPRTALGTSTLIDLVVGAVLVVMWRSLPQERRLLARLCVSIAAGTAIGAVLAGELPTRLLLVIIGVSVVALAIRLARTGATALPSTRATRSLWLAGFLAGVSGGLIGISGPFVVASTAGRDKSAMRRMLVAVFLIEGIVKVVVYSMNGIIDGDTVRLSLYATPAIIAGLATGAALHNRVDQRTFLRVLAAVLVVAGIQPLLRAL